MIWGYPHFWEPQYVNHPFPIFRSLTRLTLVEYTWGSVKILRGLSSGTWEKISSVYTWGILKHGAMFDYQRVA